MGKIQNDTSDLVILKNRNTKCSQICTLNIVRLVIGQYFLNFLSMGTSFLTYNVFYRHLTWQLKVKESESRSVVSNSLQPHGLYSPWDSPGQNTGLGSLSLLQGIFPTQGLNPGLLHCRQILYHLSHMGSLCGNPYMIAISVNLKHT